MTKVFAGIIIGIIVYKVIGSNYKVLKRRQKCPTKKTKK
jgi:hypothetical protein